LRKFAEKALAATKRIIRKALPEGMQGGSHSFPGSYTYWLDRYASGGNSGPGSYDQLAEFKAEVLNSYVAEHGIHSVIELGCGDGNQLLYSLYPSYIGFDISSSAIEQCVKRFRERTDMQFKLMSEYAGETADLAISLDVVFHLVEDSTFESYMRTLFASAGRAVIIFSSDKDEPINPIASHVRHRKFTDWVQTNIVGWKLSQRVPNKYPYDGDYTRTSFADFFIFHKA
jgi:hypothetical protein